MSDSPASGITLHQIIERKLSFLLNNDICPWDGDKSDLGERDALQQMLSDSISFSEKLFEAKYLAEVARLSKRIEMKEDNDDYYESFSNTIVSVLALINPINIYDLGGE
ncbi:hypothetical protein NBRC116592_03810 [Colwellia sp. KU-HH00111]|uniref:hypothetical protein n=1 Tax=Colwellia sp. KU-HH00111 TaxID=3127652 RepID=UPI0031099A5B